MGAAPERRRDLGDGSGGVERRGGVTVGAPDRQARIERARGIDGREQRAFELGGGVGGRGALQDLAVGDAADDALG